MKNLNHLLSVPVLSLSHLSLPRNQWLRNYFLTNLIVAGLFFIGQELEAIHWPYLLYVVGLPVFFLPGLNLALATEQLSGVKQSSNRIFILTFVYSLVFTPAAVYYLGILLHRDPITNDLSLFAILWAIAVALLLIFQGVKK